MASAGHTIKYHISWRVWSVAIVALFERAAFWGITAPWQNYMENPLTHDASQSPGALGLGQSTATRIYCAFYIFYYCSPVVAAVIADSVLGRFETLLISTGIYCLGCVVLTVSSTLANLSKGWGIPGLAVAMALIGAGGGGFRVVIVPFMIDQHDRKQPAVTTQIGIYGINEDELTVQFICSLYFWIGNVGSLSWFATVYLEQRYSFAAAYALALVAIVMALLILVSLGKWYVREPSERGGVSTIRRIIACACKHGFNTRKADPEYQRVIHQHAVPWSSQLVQKVSRALRACRVLLAFVTFYVCFDQMQNNFISQAGRMKTDGVPNDLLPAMNQVGCIVFVPMISLVVYPQLYHRKLYPTPIMRITTGFLFTTLSMVWAAALQQAIYDASPCFPDAQRCSFNEIDVWLQAPVYLLLSIGEAFALATGIEFAYNQSPKEARVIVQAVGSLIAALGSAIAMSLTPVARDPRLVFFYASLAGAMAATTVVFWFLFHNYGNSLPESEESPCSSIIETSAAVAKSAPRLSPIESAPRIDIFENAPPLPRRSSRRIKMRDAPALAIRTPELTHRAETLGASQMVASRFPSSRMGSDRVGVSEAAHREGPIIRSKRTVLPLEGQSN